MIDVSGTLAEVGLTRLDRNIRDRHTHLPLGYSENPQRRVRLVPLHQRSSVIWIDLSEGYLLLLAELGPGTGVWEFGLICFPSL